MLTIVFCFNKLVKHSYHRSKNNVRNIGNSNRHRQKIKLIQNTKTKENVTITFTLFTLLKNQMILNCDTTNEKELLYTKMSALNFISLI